MASFGIKVFDFGAKGDGITDDTAPPFRLQLILPQSVAAERFCSPLPRKVIELPPPILKKLTESPFAHSWLSLRETPIFN